MNPRRRISGGRWGGGAAVWLVASATALGGGVLGACTGVITDDRSGPQNRDGRAPGTGGVGGYQKPVGACRITMPLRRLTEQQYRHSVVEVFKGVVEPSTLFPKGELGSSATGFSTEPAVNVVTRLGAEHVLESAEEVALAVAGKLDALLSCSPVADENCARAFILEYGTRAFRRPITDAETTTLLNVWKQGDGNFPLGIALVVSTLLQSPQFLYLAEPGETVDGDDSVRRLSGYEIASRLSFALWDSTPDGALLEAAAAGRLQEPGEIRAQAARMLDDDRARATLHRFAAEWLHLRALKGADRASPDFDDELAQAQVRELDLFVQDAFLGQGTLRSLLTSRESFVDRRMARYYGIDDTGFEDGVFEPVFLEGPERSGLLTLPAVLTSKAAADEPSYVFRGTFVLEKLLCHDMPVPPAGAAERLPDFPSDATQREKSDLIRGVTECGGCHNVIDPIGLAFEGFDEIGRVRAHLPDGRDVDTSGVINGIDDALDGSFTSPAELAGRMANSPLVERCMARQVLRFAFSRPDDDGGLDGCAVDDLVYQYGTRDQSLRELLLAVTQLEGFRMRKLAGDQQ